jgi:putative endonuclease
MLGKRRGTEAERQARHHLERQGLEFVAANYHCRRGEIDLVMRDGDTLVFVEVRQRTNPRFGGAAASVDFRKQHKLILTAEHYLQKHPHDGPVRIDVVAMAQENAIDWIRNAFQAS